MPDSRWRTTSLGDVVNLKRGYDLPDRVRKEGPFPVVSSSGLTGTHDAAKVEPPGVVTGRYGTLGKVYFIEQPFWPLNTTLYVQDFKGNDPRFVSYLLESLDLAGLVASAAVPGINRNHLHPLSVTLPDLSLQTKLAGALATFDELIENNRRRIDILEEMARLIYREWFVHFRFPGHENVEFVDSDLGSIPEGWDSVPLSDLVTTQYGYTESAQNEPVGPRFLRGMDMNKNSYIDWSAVPFCPISDKDREKFKVEVGDVFVIRMADPGKIGICEREIDAVFASYLVRLRPTTERLTSYYLFFTLCDERYQGWITGASTGATRKSVSAKVMTEPSIVLPPSEMQSQFVEAIAPLRGLLTNLLEQNGVLASARDLLLPRLISGELDVSELELDPESVA